MTSDCLIFEVYITPDYETKLKAGLRTEINFQPINYSLKNSATRAQSLTCPFVFG